jgi:hypothetical protein
MEEIVDRKGQDENGADDREGTQHAAPIGSQRIVPLLSPGESEPLIIVHACIPKWSCDSMDDAAAGHVVGRCLPASVIVYEESGRMSICGQSGRCRPNLYQIRYRLSLAGHTPECRDLSL